MILETTRLRLRPWLEDDAKSLYKYAKNPNIGPSAGWPVHTSVANSRFIIENVLAKEETYAITIKPNDEVVGSLGLMFCEDSNLAIQENEVEIGYWLGEPFWGQGYVPEAVEEALRHAFEDLHVSVVWCGYFDGNEKSKRVNEKCGFFYQRLEKEKEFHLISAVHDLHVTNMTSEQWKGKKHGVI